MKLATNSLLSFLPSALAIIISIVTVPIYIKLIGAERYGALMISWLLLGYFGQADFGIGRAIAQRIGSMQQSDRSAKAKAVWSALISVAGFGLIGAGLIYLAGNLFFAELFKVGPGVRMELLHSLGLLALCVPVIAISGVFSGALTGLERFKLVAVGNTVSNAASQILPLVIAFQFTHDLRYLIGAALFGRFIGLLPVAIGVWRTFLAGETIAPSRDEFRRLASFGAWIMVTAFVGPLMTMFDRFVIGAVLGAVAVVAYSVPFQIATRTMILPYSIIQALFPHLAAQQQERSLEISKTSFIVIGQWYAPCVIGLICLAGPLLKLWLGEDLDERSVLIGQIVLAGFWMNALANVPYTYLQARGNPRFTALLHLTELPVYFALLYLLGSTFGLAGAATAFAIRCAVDCPALMAKAGMWEGRTFLRLMPQAVLIVLSLAWSASSVLWLPNLVAATALCSAALVLALTQMPDAMRQALLGSQLARKMPWLAQQLGRLHG